METLGFGVRGQIGTAFGRLRRRFAPVNIGGGIAEIGDIELEIAQPHRTVGFAPVKVIAFAVAM